MIKDYVEKEYIGYHKKKRIVGPVSHDKMVYWKHIVKLNWGWRVKKHD